jgi:hypothetical protein
VDRSRSATPAAEPQTEARRSCGIMRMAARDERTDLRSGTGVVEGETGPTGSPWSEANRALVTAVGILQVCGKKKLRSSLIAYSGQSDWSLRSLLPSGKDRHQ